MINGHGNDLYNYKEEIVSDFSSNIYYKGPDKKLIGHLSEKLRLISDYPNPSAHEILNKLALLYKLKPVNITVTNGSTEALYLIAQFFKGCKSLIIVPSFSEYEDASRVHEHDIVFTTTDFFNSDYISQFKLCWICNPNNPDAKIHSLKNLDEICRENPDTFFVIDEAYAGLTYKFESAISLIERYKNVILVKSLTKDFGIPGIRLGYIIADEEFVEKINNIKMPWNVNSQAIEAASFIIQNYKELEPDVEQVFKESQRFQNELNKVEGLEVIPSSSNFFLVKMKKDRVKLLKDYLIKSYGFLIRDASNFRNLDERFFRLSVRSKDENNCLIKAIIEWYSI